MKKFKESKLYEWLEEDIRGEENYWLSWVWIVLTGLVLAFLWLSKIMTLLVLLGVCTLITNLVLDIINYRGVQFGRLIHMGALVLCASVLLTTQGWFVFPEYGLKDGKVTKIGLLDKYGSIFYHKANIGLYNTAHYEVRITNYSLPDKERGLEGSDIRYAKAMIPALLCSDADLDNLNLAILQACRKAKVDIEIRTSHPLGYMARVYDRSSGWTEELRRDERFALEPVPKALQTNQ